jgi:hypothetical protein
MAQKITLPQAAQKGRQQGRSDCLECHAVAGELSRHGVRCFSMAFPIVSNVRIQAVSATLGALPA